MSELPPDEGRNMKDKATIVIIHEQFREEMPIIDAAQMIRSQNLRVSESGPVALQPPFEVEHPFTATAYIDRDREARFVLKGGCTQLQALQHLVNRGWHCDGDTMILMPGHIDNISQMEEVRSRHCDSTYSPFSGIVSCHGEGAVAGEF